MIVGKNNLLEWFRMKEVPYWFVYHQSKTDSGNWAEKCNTEGTTPEQAIQKLSQFLNLQSRGKYTIVACEELTAAGWPAAKGKFIHDYEIPLSENTTATTSAVAGIPEGYVSKSKIGAIVQKRFDEHLRALEHKELQKRTAELEKENKQLQQQAESGWNTFIGAIQPYLGVLMQKIIPGGPAQLAGIPPGYTNEENPTTTTMNEINVVDLTDEQHARLEKVVTKLQMALPGDKWLEGLEKLTAKVEKNPGLINMINLL